MNDPVVAIQTSAINLTCVRIPPDLAGTGIVPDEANDFMTTFGQVAGHGRPNHPI
jgi:hypothetical protein